MKTNNFLWATLATAILTLTGCSSDDNELTVPQLQDKTALLELRLIGNGINTKATGDNLPTQAEENIVKYFTVAIFNSDNTVNTLHTVTEKHSLGNNHQLHTGNRLHRYRSSQRSFR